MQNNEASEQEQVLPVKNQKRASGISDEELVHLLALDLKTNFEQLVSTYQTLLYAIAYRKLNNRELASDAVQETFLRAYIALVRHPEIIGPLKVKAWLCKILINCVNDIFEKEGRQQEAWQQLNEALRELFVLNQGADIRLDSINIVVHREQLEKVGQIIHTFSPERQLVLLLHFQAGLKEIEIVRLLGWPRGTVHAHIFYGTQIIRSEMEKEN